MSESLLNDINTKICNLKKLTIENNYSDNLNLNLLILNLNLIEDLLEQKKKINKYNSYLVSFEKEIEYFLSKYKK